MIRLPLVLACSAVAAAFAAWPAHAQTQPRIDCPYAECALRIKHRFFGRDLVRGTAETSADGLGLWAGDITSVFTGHALSQELAASYRRRQNVGSALFLAGLALVTVAPILGEGNPDDFPSYAPLWWGMAGLGVSIAGGVLQVGAQERLSRAIWEYNRALAP